MAPRLSFLGALLLSVAFAQLAVLSCQTLHGSVACLDCMAQHNLSGVVVAVKCRDGAGLRAAQTDAKGYFEMDMPAIRGLGCAARVLGGPEQLCAPQRLTVARIVAGRSPGSYTLGSRLAFFVRCSTGGGAAAAKMVAGDGRPPRRAVSPPASPLLRPSLPQQTPVPSPSSGSAGSPPYDLGLPLIYFFPFIPIIGIP